MPSAFRISSLLAIFTSDAGAGITNGNIYAPTMMIAEKAADLVLGNTPLKPLPLQFHRRNDLRCSKAL
jgi:choline dehydrogenase